MLAKTTVVAVGALIIAGAFIECLDHSTQKTAGCLRACGLHNQKILTKRDQARLSPSCNQCLRRRRDLEKRRRRSLGDCPSRADESSPAPEKQLASNLAVKFGQYDNTDNWYAEVSWSPIDDSSGFLKGYSVRYLFDSEVLCAEVPKSQTSLRINLSRYGYNQEEPIHLVVVSLPTSLTHITLLSFLNDKAGCLSRADESSPAPEKQLASNVAVKFGQYDNTDDWYADVSWSPIDDSSGFLKGYLVRYLSVDSEVLCYEVPKSQTSLRINLSRYGYNKEEPLHLLVVSFPTNLTSVTMLSFLNDKASSSTSPPPPQTITSVVVTTKSSTAAKVSTTAKVSTSTKVSATTKGSTTGKVSTTATVSAVRATTNGSDITMKYVTISVGAVAGFLAVVLAAVSHKRFIRICVQHGKSKYGRPSSDPEPENREVFMIFNSGDGNWVEEKAVPLIEKQLGLKCRIHYKDFKAGGVIYDMMSESVCGSYKNVMVYSRNFLKDRYCQFEFNQAKLRLLRDDDDSLVIVRIDDVDLGLLPKDLQSRGVIDYGSERERPHWEGILTEFLKAPQKNRHESTKTNDTVVSSLDIDPDKDVVFV